MPSFDATGEGFKIVMVDPPIDRRVLQTRVVAFGYYSWSTNTFFQWENASFAADNVPAIPANELGEVLVEQQPAPMW